MYVMKFRSNYLFLALPMLVFACNAPDEIGTLPPKEEVLDTIKYFTNPVYDVGPDPWVIERDDQYYVTYTTGRSLKLIRTDKMSQLRSNRSVERTVWTPPATGMNSDEIWAPELHYLDGAWYIYYAASDGRNENHRMWVVRTTSAEPLTGTWESLGELELPDDKWAIDGSPVDIGGQRYFAWSGWEGDVNVRQDIYLAKMDSPTRVSGPRVMLLRPREEWERNGTNPEVAEGPQFLAHEGKQFMFYSAGACWKDGYSIGAMVLTPGADPMDAASWSRLPQNPLLTSNPSGGAYGPGHNSFFKSPDGTEDWILYHANRNSGDGCADLRSIRMHRFTWSSDGLPQLGIPAATGQRIPVPSGE